MPVTLPDASTVAFSMFDDDHTPPPVAPVSRMPAPVQIVVGPVIGPGAASVFIDTVTVAVLSHSPGALPVTVYVVVTAGLAVMLAPVADDSPTEGDQL
jgi:hypothetical protein